MPKSEKRSKKHKSPKTEKPAEPKKSINLGRKKVPEGQWKNLPVSALTTMSKYVDFGDVVQLEKVCSAWREKVRDEVIWSDSYTKSYEDAYGDDNDELRFFREQVMMEGYTTSLLNIYESQYELVKYALTRSNADIPALPMIRSIVGSGISLDLECEHDQRERIKGLQNQLRKGYRKTSGLQKKLGQKEQKISLIIGHQSSIVEIERNKKKLKKKKKGDDSEEYEDFTKNASIMEAYAGLFYILRSEPQYLADLTQLVKVKIRTEFTEAVILSLFGNAFTVQEKYMILDILTKSLRAEFVYTAKLGDGPNYMTQTDTVVPQMIISYTRGKQGSLYVKKTFRKIIENLNDEAEDYGFSPMARVPVELGAMKKLLENLFDAITSTLEDVPYGIRYICKVIYNLSREFYPDCSEDEILQTISFFAIYKFIGSSISNPESCGIVETTESIDDNVKATLAYAAKALQLMFLFKEGDDKLVGLNDFIVGSHERCKEFLKAFIDVEDPDVHLKINRYNKLAGTQNPTVIMGVQEIVMLHKLASTYASKIIHEDDSPLAKTLNDLGSVPHIDPQDSRTVQLQLASKYRIKIKAENVELDKKQETLHYAIQLFDKLRVPAGKTFLEMLVKAKLNAEKNGNTKIVEQVSELLDKLEYLATKNMISHEDGYNSFLNDIKEEIADIKERIVEQREEIQKLTTALEELEEQQSSITDKIEAFDSYLSTLRREVEDGFEQKSKKFSYKQLDKRGVISEVLVEDSIGVVKKLTFVITQVAIDCFEIVAKAKGVKIGKTVSLNLEDLLEAKENAERTYDTGIIHIYNLIYRSSFLGCSCDTYDDKLAFLFSLGAYIYSFEIKLLLAINSLILCNVAVLSSTGALHFYYFLKQFKALRPTTPKKDKQKYFIHIT